MLYGLRLGPRGGRPLFFFACCFPLDSAERLRVAIRGLMAADTAPAPASLIKERLDVMDFSLDIIDSQDVIH